MNAAALQRDAARNEKAIGLWRCMHECKAAGDNEGYVRSRTSLFEMFECLSFALIARFLSQEWLSPDDLRQECRLAVLQAIDHWNPERGELPVLLTYYTRKRVRQYLRNSELIKRSHSVFDKHGQETRQGRESAETARISVLSFSLPEKPLYEGDSTDMLDHLVADPDTPYDRIQMRTAIAQAMDYLRPEDRESVTLHFGLDGNDPLPYREIGPLIGATYQTAKNRVERALPILAAALDGCL